MPNSAIGQHMMLLPDNFNAEMPGTDMKVGYEVNCFVLVVNLQRIPLFSLLEGKCKKKPMDAIYHVTFFYCPQKEAPKTYSIYRSQDFELAKNVYQSCLQCRDLFALIGVS